MTRLALIATVALVAVAVAAAGLSAVNSGASTLKRSPLVGRWSRLNTCRELVAALQKAGLGATAPAAVDGFFPGSTPQQLAAKPDLCSGASPTKHSHFFTKRGTFGSIDQNGRQDDNGHYRILSHHRVRITNSDVLDSKFHYRVINGNRLQLTPIITKAMRSTALVAPLIFNVAAWEVAVSYTGHTWKRVRCGAWCSS